MNNKAIFLVFLLYRCFVGQGLSLLVYDCICMNKDRLLMVKARGWCMKMEKGKKQMDLNIISFWAALTFLLLFAYPTPEFLTPSYEFHTAFNGVALGIVIGVHQTYQQFHHDDVARLFSMQLPVSALAGRLLLGIPTILAVKFCSKALAKWILPTLAYTLGIPIMSKSYLPAMKGGSTDKKTDQVKQSSYIQKLLFFSKQTLFDVDTGIRLLQYAGLAWSVVDLVFILKLTYTD